MKKILIFPYLIAFCISACANNQDASASIIDESINSSSSSSEVVTHLRFDEEFLEGSTIRDYADLEFFLFDSSVTDELEGLTQEDYMNYRRIDCSPFENKDLYNNSKIIEYRPRDYFSVFYYKEPIYLGRIIECILGAYGYEYVGFPKYSLDSLRREHGDESYCDYFKFLNVNRLEDIPYIFEGFYAYNVIHLIDLYDSSGYLNTTFEFHLFTINNADEMCFYDTKIGVKGYNYDIPYSNSHSYFAYYDHDRYDDMKIVPYLPHPYWYSSPMMTRNEVDDEYVYYHVSSNQPIKGELLVIDKTILQYDPVLQKSVEKIVTSYYSKVPLADVIPVE